MVLLKVLDGFFGIVGWIANIDCVVYQFFDSRQIASAKSPYTNIRSFSHFSSGSGTYSVVRFLIA
jgi:hypothetical protein